ncbi:MAG: ribosome maturation factor RimM [Dehalococcoidia bacterium]|nr:ribosome maturation factor RimM [Dehalococcoidia bacterium]
MEDENNAPRFLTIGEVAGPFGLRGELKVSIVTQFPERFAGLALVYLNEAPFEVESCRFHKRMVILKLRGIDSIEEADKLRGRLVEVLRSEAVPLSNDHYYHYQIIGLEVWTSDGRLIGKIEEILTLPANDVYLVRFNGKEVLIPAIEDVVLQIDIESGRIIIEPIPGLLD